MAARSHDRPVLRRSVDFIHSFVRAQDLKPGDRLPPLRRLASEAGVSFVTMCRALRAVRETGLLAVGPGRGYTVSGSASVNDTGARRQPRLSLALTPPRAPWQRVARQVEDDVRNGGYQPGAALPSMKELQRRYHITYKTLRKSLAHLVRTRSLDQLPGGGYGVPAFSTTVPRPRIVCVVPSVDTHTMAFGQGDEALFRALEAHCQQAGISLDVHLMFFDQEQGRLRFRRKTTGDIYESENLRSVDEPSVLGFMHFIPWEPTQFNLQVIRSLAGNGKPLAVLDETATLELPRGLAESRDLRIFTATATAGPAAMVARRLLTLGHRGIAFVSVFHSYTWSRRRLEGLQDACKETGLAAEVYPFVAESTSQTPDQTARAYRIGPLTASYRSWRRAVTGPGILDFDDVFRELSHHTPATAQTRSLLYPLLARALDTPAITAWVMVNDAAALMALTFLKDRNVRVPADLSIVSFDDSVEALRASLSSFNFNIPAVAAAMLGFVLGTRPYARSGPAVAGFLVDRGTLGPPARRA